MNAITPMPMPFDSGKSRETENFPVGSILIRPDLRAHVHAFYDFARAADDISDHPIMDAQEKIRQLDGFGYCLTHDGDTSVPPAAALRDSLRQTGVSPRHSLDLLTAFKRDATQLRYRDWDDLIDYCTYSAAPVGRHVLALHGIGDIAWPANDALCNALQIINHIQDCGDDYRQLDRVYIPHDLLVAHGGQISDLAAEECGLGLRQTLQAMLQLTQPLVEAARDLPRHVPDVRLKMETSVIQVLAQRLVGLLRERDPLRDNVKLSKFSMATATVQGILRAWF